MLCVDSTYRRLPHLPDALREADIPFEELVVYHTSTAASSTDISKPPSWVVFFSPSGVAAALEVQLPYSALFFFLVCACIQSLIFMCIYRHLVAIFL